VPRTLALDLGKARVGVAIDDELGSMGHARGVLDAHNQKTFLAALKKLCDDSDVSRIVVGLPVDMRGHEGDAARRARVLAQAIADATGIEVEMWDERLTTVVAARALSASGVRARDAKARVDTVAAVAILESWLAAQRHPGTEGG
jgi:putative holliday junction resolvase